SSLLALPEARRQSGYGIRCLPDLRSCGLLQRTEWSGLQKLRGPDQRANRGNGWRMQSHSAACRTELRGCDYPRTGYCGGRPRLSAIDNQEIHHNHVLAPTVRVVPEAETAKTI